MVTGTGVDLIRIERIRTAIERWDSRFLRRIFTENEISYCYSKKYPYASLAVRFAAKEALIKALGSEYFIPFTDIEVLLDNKGKPFINPGERLRVILAERAIASLHLSLSHETDYGVATVIIEGAP